eukprot:CAMPEP_0168445200 /NCGR_PEP_ID=MMETSP0228-20121227/45446_1 /TAXON_ID=133427 /ORGANISM="Protoceratium reticulatum, Strain CCCM 535 (=CCMP 1889)" /LENGTH=111 /DNA_ID=CAMNT_0008459675 /DNA_START=257 /DNA_END=592 /DNA_ORIENTATION=-
MSASRRVKEYRPIPIFWLVHETVREHVNTLQRSQLDAHRLRDARVLQAPPVKALDKPLCAAGRQEVDECEATICPAPLVQWKVKEVVLPKEARTVDLAEQAPLGEPSRDVL